MSVAENDVQRRLEGVRRDVREWEANRPSPLPWLGKRLLLLAIASGSAGYAFHLFGTWPLGLIAILTPLVGWTLLLLKMGSRFERAHPLRNIDRVVDRDSYSGRTTALAIETLDAQRDMRRRFGL